MAPEEFIIVGENIHCTRVFKRGGVRTQALPGGGEAVKFTWQDEAQQLPVPCGWEDVSPAYTEGKIKHVALAVHLMRNGTAAEQERGTAYLCYLAERQINAGASFLDLNVDEYSTDPAVQVETMACMAEFLSCRYDVPLSIDSSNPTTLRTGLAQCRQDIRPPMINSISLERPEMIDLAVEFKADAIVNAAGREGMPAGVDDRMANFRELAAATTAAGIELERVHFDPLVLPISVDPMNGSHFLGATSAARSEFPGAHLNGGLSNVSFGMPNRKLLNTVFVRLCLEAGTDGGIVDPVSMPLAEVAQLDPATEPYRLAQAVLTGEDMFGMEYIGAFRDGRLG